MNTVGNTPDSVVITGRLRTAPAAAGTGIPADVDEAYRRGICVDCKTAWYAPGQPPCTTCHEGFVLGGRSVAKVGR
ncbi:MAG: hypothetical protein WCE30_00960 [Mycobacterium sp.]